MGAAALLPSFPSHRCTAIDCGRYGIRVNAVCPGPILTDATRKHAETRVRYARL